MGNNKNLHGHLFALTANVMWGLMSPIAVVHMLLFAEDGKYPECRCRTYHTKRGDGDS